MRNLPTYFQINEKNKMINSRMNNYRNDLNCHIAIADAVKQF